MKVGSKLFTSFLCVFFCSVHTVNYIYPTHWKKANKRIETYFNSPYDLHAKLPYENSTIVIFLRNNKDQILCSFKMVNSLTKSLPKRSFIRQAKPKVQRSRLVIIYI